MMTRLFTLARSASTVTGTVLVLATSAACSGTAFGGDGSDGGTLRPDAGRSEEAGSSDVATGRMNDTSSGDASPRSDASTDLDARPVGLPNASGPVAACESCLQSTCGTDLGKCEADPNCTAAIDCAISSGCIVPDDAGVTTCVDTCIKNGGLTPHEQAEVVAELAALSDCAAPCVSHCALKDGAE